MYTLFLSLVVLSCMGEVFPRHVLDEVNDPDLLTPDQNDGIRKHTSDQNRHRRRRWQANYGAYDYPVPPQHYYPERRDYDRNQQDLLPQIVKLLEEISTYVRRPQAPPPMPQPIYIPYPVPYPVLQYRPCSENTTKKPSIHTRFPEMEDTNQNWGLVINKDDETDDLGDSRPISFDPIKPPRPMTRPAPSVEHGSKTEGIGSTWTIQNREQRAKRTEESFKLRTSQTTAAPKFDQPGALRTPTMCNAAILSCCADQNSQLCFNSFGCGLSYDSGNACSTASIDAALDSFKAAYSPVQ